MYKTNNKGPLRNTTVNKNQRNNALINYNFPCSI